MQEIDGLLNEDWGSVFTYQRDLAQKNGVVVMLYAKTMAPVKLNLVLSAASFDNLEFGHRELRRKLKDALPENVISMRISEINRILRDAPRRKLRDVEKDFLNWVESSTADIQRCYGIEAAQKYSVASASSPLGSIQDLQNSIEENIRCLQEL